MNSSLETSSPAETEALAAKIGALVLPGLVITLAGELGAGKTVFVRGLARGLGVPDATVTSPTYVLQHVYRGGRLPLYHIDAYRLRGGADEFEASGLNESFADAQGVVCVEWPERLGAFVWPAFRLEIQVEHAGLEQRRLAIRSTDARSGALLKVIEENCPVLQSLTGMEEPSNHGSSEYRQGE